MEFHQGDSAILDPPTFPFKSQSIRLIFSVHKFNAAYWIKKAQLPCRLHAYTVYTSVCGKGRCQTRCDLCDHDTQTRKNVGERSIPDLKPMRRTHKVQNRSNQSFHKMGVGPTIFFKKKKFNPGESIS